MNGIYNYIPERKQVFGVGYILMLQLVVTILVRICNAISHVECFVLIIIIIIIVQ